MKKPAKVTIALLLWLVFWFSSQFLFIYPKVFPNAPDFLGTFNSRTIRYIVYTIWILLVASVAILVWKKRWNDFSFLKVKDKKILLAYLIPFALIIYDIATNSSFGINKYIWVIGIVSTTFIAQDLVTFGILQSYLNKQLTPFLSFITTSSIFFLAHLYFDFSFGSVVVLAGAFLFGFLRFKTKNIYLLDVIHISFLLFPV